MNRDIVNNPIFWTDGYKLCHKDQYPKGTEWIYLTWTPRASQIDGVNHAVFYGLQGALKDITEQFDKYFFSADIKKIEEQYKDMALNVFGKTNPEFAKNVDTSHIRQLHAKGYLPIKVKALPEGTFTPIGVPMFTIENTTPDTFWLTGYLESQLSSSIWLPMTVATVADKLKRILTNYAHQTGDPSRVVNQVGDFSMRGMTSPESALRCSGGHLLFFNSSATIGARNYLINNYSAPSDVISYTPATEHSVMCSYGTDEYNAFKHLITKIYPSGTISIVSDTYDFWNLVDNVLPKLKKEIMSRSGKIMIRPDSGNPVEIILKLVPRLYEIFGGTVNAKGFKELDTHIGIIYGDSITIERAQEICKGLAKSRYATTNVTLGVGSLTYQRNIRDTLGFALKATAEIQNGKFKMVHKTPATDKVKRSPKGLCAAVMKNNDLVLIDSLTPETIKQIKGNLYEDVYLDGKFVKTQNYADIKEFAKKESARVYG